MLGRSRQSDPGASGMYCILAWTNALISLQMWSRRTGWRLRIYIKKVSSWNLRATERHLPYSHTVTCHLTQASVLCLNPSHAGCYSIYLPQRDGRLSLPCYSETQLPGVELATSRSRIQRPNYWATKQHKQPVNPSTNPLIHRSINWLIIHLHCTM